MSKIQPSEKEWFEGITLSAVQAYELTTLTSRKLALAQNDFLAEEDKMRLVSYRFSDINEEDLMEGDEFFTELDSGKYD
ncbi:hypothetical protein [Vibrio aestuarianus]|uniref:hypothetical protein n=1 Tax=Vibrio aestuarianus TaxID=28171 RepID=UPI0015C561CA|nr:hypothetical protein [Vibrio aestuarianus]MDE1234171.1 hypothetical protein [Vibrio aestuarianus]MDE1245157.1 hypothetical protein [Vibrio aestuarianus]NGZ63971.1 hypothetical protein [Vibrio aestuarianus subsp. cardii]NGZ69166.1 hypothetical protein [Vibrio aestuarianus subsp. cardii]